jgi:hypothetical protein
MRLAFCAIPVVALLTLSASAETSISTVCLPGGSSAVGSYTLSSVIASPRRARCCWSARPNATPDTCASKPAI